MKFASLSVSTLDRLKKYKWDRIIEKHEGPWDYESVLSYADPEFIAVDGFDVLLPVERSHHPNISILRCIPSADGDTLTIFLKDTTYVETPQREFLDAGFVAVCERFPNEDFFVTTVYHEWFMVDNSAVC